MMILRLLCFAIAAFFFWWSGAWGGIGAGPDISSKVKDEWVGIMFLCFVIALIFGVLAVAL